MFSLDDNDPKHPQLLRHMVGRFLADTGLTPIMGAELEFYVSSPLASHHPLFSAIDTACRAAGIPVSPLEKERGQNQYELQLPHCHDPLILANQLLSLRTILRQLAQDHALDILFDAKPVASEPGSALHFHISLLDEKKHNVLQKIESNESMHMDYALGGLCRTLIESMVFFSPTESSYPRFVPHMEAPTSVSWGGNNRTTALRIPDSTPENRRIEHRVPAADSNPYLAIAAILAGIHYGITHTITAPERIYGNGFDSFYGLTSLPKTLAEATEAYHRSSIMKGYIPPLHG